MLWQRSFTPSPAPFDALIREALIEQRTSGSTPASGGDVSRWDKDAHSLLWLLANDLDLVFCVAYQRILALPYVADLLHALRDAFLKSYRNTVEQIVASTSAKPTRGTSGGNNGTSIFGPEAWANLFRGWDEIFNRILREFEASSAKVRCSSRIRSSNSRPNTHAGPHRFAPGAELPLSRMQRKRPRALPRARRPVASLLEPRSSPSIY